LAKPALRAASRSEVQDIAPGRENARLPKAARAEPLPYGREGNIAGGIMPAP